MKSQEYGTITQVTLIKNTATITALFFGFLGGHLFYLGKPFKGFWNFAIGMICSLSFVIPVIMNIVSVTELAKMTEEEFIQEYLSD